MLRTINNVGLLSWLHFRLQLLRIHFSPPNSTFFLRSKTLGHPVLCRKGSSDLGVFCHVHLFREYSCLDDLEGLSFIIDAGANVGYSSAYFLSRFPRCRVVAIEPDQANYQILCRNLAPYGSRVMTLHAGLWSHPTKLKIAANHGPANEWSRQVAECSEYENGFPAFDIPLLLDLAGEHRISLLKVDIEGAEAVVFGETSRSWMGLVDNIVIELHDYTSFGESTRIFEQAIEEQPFSRDTFGELTVCKRRSS